MPDPTTPHEWLAARGELTDAEAQAAAIAVARRADDERALDALEALTPFERHLAEIAYHAGSADTLTELDKLVGIAAVTVDANTLRRGSNLNRGITFDVRELASPVREPGSGARNVVRLAEPRAIGIVAQARRRAEHEAEGNTGERDELRSRMQAKL